MGIYVLCVLRFKECLKKRQAGSKSEVTKTSAKRMEVGRRREVKKRTNYIAIVSRPTCKDSRYFATSMEKLRTLLLNGEKLFSDSDNISDIITSRR